MINGFPAVLLLHQSTRNQFSSVIPVLNIFPDLHFDSIMIIVYMWCAGGSNLWQFTVISYFVLFTYLSSTISILYITYLLWHHTWHPVDDSPQMECMYWLSCQQECFLATSAPVRISSDPIWTVPWLALIRGLLSSWANWSTKHGDNRQNLQQWPKKKKTTLHWNLNILLQSSQSYRITKSFWQTHLCMETSCLN